VGRSDVTVVRVYDDPPAADDAGARVLVDRLWPRGVKKADAALDEWAKDVAPSTELRRWYGHEPARFDEFTARYLAELHEPPAREAVEHLLELVADGPLRLVTATKDVQRSGAQVLFGHLLQRLV
jgi:uncharacterized protein YeaO (DUF488 family)